MASALQFLGICALLLGAFLSSIPVGIIVTGALVLAIGIAMEHE